MRLALHRPLLVLLMSIVACRSSVPWGHAAEIPETRTPVRRVPITIGAHGIEPARLEVARGESVELIFTRVVEDTCVTRVVISLDADRRIARDLPLGQPVPVGLSFDRAGELGFSCPMGMHAGVIRIR